jgi:DNA-binding SARP family transcriptional activator/tetratricopeptide (TPR) repeat protein
MGTTEFRVLGSVEALVDGRPIQLGTAKQRCVLALLALDACRLVHVERLVDLVWGGRPTPGARSTLHSYVSRLRARLARCPDVTLTTSGPCYQLEVDPEQVDVHRFRRLIADARATPSGRETVRLLRQALALWRGQPLGDVAPPHLRSTLCASLDEERLAAWEELADVELRLGGHTGLLTELRELTERHPLRERLAAAFVVALYRNGQRADALAHCQRLRFRLSTELGIDPSPGLDELHQRVLRDDPDLMGAGAGAGRSGEVSAPQVVPAELPADVGTFTGRTAELARLGALPVGGPAATPTAAAVAIIAIDGMAGVGKTALAVHWAHQVRHRFPDGQLFVDLHGHSQHAAPVDPAVALERVLRTLGLPADRLTQGRDELAALYRSALADRRVLVVLDNAATEDQVRPLLPGTPGCLVMVTSRRRLTGLDGAYPLSLDVLPLSDAVALFTRTARPGRCGNAEAGLVEEIVELCGRLPLAVRIAAARLLARPSWRVEYLAELLRGERGRLAELDPGQRGVTAAFALSYRELTPRQRRVFRLLGLHPGPEIDAAAAAALAGSDPSGTARVLEDLVDVHLLRSPAPGRYALHDLLRTFAAQRAVEEEPEAERRSALDRLHDVYLHAATVATGLLYPHDRRQGPGGARDDTAGNGDDHSGTGLTDAARAAAWLDAELPNLLATAAHAAEHGPQSYTAQMSRVLWRYLYERSHLTAALALHGHAARAARSICGADEEAHALVNLGTVHGRLGAYEESLGALRRALELYRRAGDRGGEVRTLGNLGVVHERLGHYGKALDHLGQALALYRAAGDRGGEASALLNLGIVHGRTGGYGVAADHLRQALALFRETGNRGSEARALVNLAIADGRMGRLDEALDRHRQALALFRETGNRDQEGYPLNDMGAIFRRQGRYGLALDHHRQALALFRRSGNRTGEAETLNDLGMTLRAGGRAADALAHHRDSLALAGQLGDRYEQARAHNGLAHACHDLGDRDGARQHWQAAARILADLGSPDHDEVLTALAALDRPSGHLAGR